MAGMRVTIRLPPALRQRLAELEREAPEALATAVRAEADRVREEARRDMVYLSFLYDLTDQPRFR